jgi:diaminopimelate epimerase
MLPFTKMHGAGNDFIVIAPDGEERDWPALARRMCDRHFGVGADGILLVLPSDVADLRMRIVNADGSEAEMCGNGARCVAKYAVERGLVPSERFRLETGAGVVAVEAVRDAGGAVTSARVSMGRPRFFPSDIPVSIEAEPPLRNVSLTVDGQTVAVTILSMGNPHAVHFWARPVPAYPLAQVGPRMEHHPAFPNRTNFEIARVLDRGRIEARVWERGVGETLACGSGACAVAVAARILHLVDDLVEVALPGGTLTVEWDGAGDVLLSGPVEEVFAGTWPD